jgi:predicted nucleotidyltransferase
MSGRFSEVDQLLLEEVVTRIRETANPERIILFGSAATGGMGQDSDLDLLVLLNSPENPRQESVRIRSGLRGLGWPIDVLVMDRERFDQTKDLVGGLAYPAHRYGRVLYAVS